MYLAKHRDHKNSKNKHFYNAIRKYGKRNFEVRILFTCYDQKTLNDSETYFISFFEATNKDFGYNKALGGIGGHFTEETKKQMSESHKGTKWGHHTEETKKRMSLAQKGKPKYKLRGRKQPKEVGERISAAKKGVPVPLERRLRISATLKGRPMPLAQRLQISKTTKGRKGRSPTQEERERISKTLTGREGRPQSPESREKISKALTGRESPLKGSTKTEEEKEAMRLGWVRRRERLEKEKQDASK